MEELVLNKNDNPPIPKLIQVPPRSADADCFFETMLLHNIRSRRVLHELFSCDEFSQLLEMVASIGSQILIGEH
jgi:hypothetical protein